MQFGALFQMLGYEVLISLRGETFMYFYIHIIKCKDEKSNMDRVVLALWGRLGSAGYEYGWPGGGESEP